MNRTTMTILILKWALLSDHNALVLVLRPLQSAMGSPESLMIKPADPIRIIYPENRSVVANDWLKADPGLCDPSDPRLIVDREGDLLPGQCRGQGTSNFFFLRLPPDRHEFTVAYRNKRNSIEYKGAVAITTINPGSPPFNPIDKDTCSIPYRCFGSTIAGFHPMACIPDTALIKTHVDSRMFFWVMNATREWRYFDADQNFYSIGNQTYALLRGGNDKKLQEKEHSNYKPITKGGYQNEAILEGMGFIRYHCFHQQSLSQ